MYTSALCSALHYLLYQLEGVRPLEALRRRGAQCPRRLHNERSLSGAWSVQDIVPFKF